MAAEKKLSWSNGKVGYDPGQSQSLTIEYKKRNTNKISVSVSFYAKSLGQDDYSRSQRWNKATVLIYRRGSKGKDDALLGSHTWSYQLHGGYGTSTSHSDTFTFSAKNGETKFNVYYTNKRQGTNTPWYGPKSTGDTSTEYGHDKIDMGVLLTDDNSKVKINYYTGGLLESKIKNWPKDTEIYKGNNYTVSKNKPSNHPYYTFNGGYTDNDNWKKKGDVNTSKPTIKPGDTIKDVDKTLSLYGTWKPRTFTFKFFTDDSLKNEITGIRQTRKFGTPGKVVPTLSEGDIGYKEGCKHIGWKHYKDGELIYHKIGATCTMLKNTNSWPVWEVLTSTITFNFCYSESEEITKQFSYEYGTTFDLSNAIKDENGNPIKPTAVRPGYKLVGWSRTKPKKVFLPNESVYGTDYIYSVYDEQDLSRNMSSEEFLNGITLYAVWEYYTMLYVYDGTRWHLSIPYVLDDNKEWKMSMALGYIEENNSWKL